MEAVILDTNVVLRLVLRDDERQYQRAVKLLEAERVVVPQTVILEAEWVLRSVFKCEPKEIAQALSDFLSMRRIYVNERARVLEALERYRSGFDFADALHYLLSDWEGEMKSFDQRFVRKGKRQGWSISAP